MRRFRLITLFTTVLVALAALAISRGPQPSSMRSVSEGVMLKASRLLPSSDAEPAIGPSIPNDWKEARPVAAADDGKPSAAATSGHRDDPSPGEAASVPPDVRYEPQVVLARMRPGTSLEDVAEALLGVPDVSGYELVDDGSAEGLVRIELGEGTSVEQAVREMQGIDDAIVGVQPNYEYAVLDAGMVDDLRARLAPCSAGVDVPFDDAASVVAHDADAEHAGSESSLASDDTDVPASEPSEGEPPSQQDREGASEDEGGAVAAGDGSPSGQRQGPPADEGTNEDGDGMPASILASAVGVSDPRSSNQWALGSMGIYEAWAIARAGEPPEGMAVTVAVLDTGFDITHEDLRANVVGAYNARTGGTSAASLLAGTRTANPSHGTHVAGIISAVANNGIGVAGASYNARVMPIRVTDDAGTAYTTDLVSAYRYLIARASAYNVRVVNLSMGMVGSSFRSDDAFLQKIDEAHRAGIVTVSAAGNANLASVPYDCYPADYGTVVSVINLRRSGDGLARAESSNYNRDGETDKNISAPGTDILSTVPGGAYATMSGTSMASPAVASVLALEFAANPALSASQAQQVLYGTAQDLGDPGFDVRYGYGQVDAAKATRVARDVATPAQTQRQEAGNQRVSEARALIAALPQATEVTLSDREVIARARAAYDGLSAVDQAGIDAGALVRAEARIAELERIAATTASITYHVHSKSVGWQDWAGDGAVSGTPGSALRVEAISMALVTQGLTGSILYRSDVEGIGWQDWVGDGAMSGTSGRGRRLEALQVRLSGAVAERYDVWYRVYAQEFGWMGWARNGESAGTSAYGYRLEAVQLQLVEKDGGAPGQVAYAFRSPVTYEAHVQNRGWQAAVHDGAMIGTTGRGLRLESIRLAVPCAQYSGSIQYRSHIQNIGWESSWKCDGAMSGTTGRSLRVEAIQVRLTGVLAERYDVWYRVHAKNFGWMGWAKNGACAGSTGYGYRAEAMQVLLVEKGGGAPGVTVGAFRGKV